MKIASAVWTLYIEHATPVYPQMLELLSLTSGGRSVSIVPLRTKDPGVCSFVTVNASTACY
jgi:hypothetical protein